MKVLRKRVLEHAGLRMVATNSHGYRETFNWAESCHEILAGTAPKAELFLILTYMTYATHDPVR